MTATVTKLTTSKRIKPVVRSRASKHVRKQLWAAGFLGVVAIVVTCLSLFHLARGFSVVTHAGWIESLAMAIGIDLGFVGVEYSQLVCCEKLRHSTGFLAKGAVYTLMTLSAAANGFAFGGNAENGWMMCAGIALGVIIPALIFAFTRIGAAIYIESTSRAS